jgi:hypothetical protein
VCLTVSIACIYLYMYKKCVSAHIVYVFVYDVHVRISLYESSVCGHVYVTVWILIICSYDMLVYLQDLALINLYYVLCHVNVYVRELGLYRVVDSFT